MKQPSLSCRQARQIDMADYLAQLGYHPQKIHGADHWYLSPFRQEKTPSFKVNRRLNMWYDHGEGRGGDLIDFGTLYHKCAVRELLDRLSQYRSGNSLSFPPPSFPGTSPPPRPSFAGEKKDSPESKIVILDTRPLANHALVGYLEKRGIQMDVAQRSCREVDFLLYGKQQTVIGFPNRSGGYELRGEYFKGGSAPKDVSFFDNCTEQVIVFEGFFNYLSFQTINRNLNATLTNSLVLNSLSFLEKCRPLMEKHSQVFLALDRDNAGITQTKQALQWDRDKYIDRSDFYQGRKDLNEWLIHKIQQQPGLDQRPRIGRSL